MSRNNFDNYNGYNDYNNYGGYNQPNYESVAAGYTVSPTMPADAGAAFINANVATEPDIPQVQADYGTEPMDAPMAPVGATQVADEYESEGEKIRPVVGWLIVTNGNQKGKSFNLHAGRNYVGRGDECDVRLSDNTISRKPALQVVYEPKGRLFLVGSCDGTSILSYCNGNILMSAQKLNAYDRITIGEVEMLFLPLCGEQFSWDE